jgi:hypothetical protein
VGAALHIQERQVWHFTQADADYGRRVAQGLGIAPILFETTNCPKDQLHNYKITWYTIV